MNTISDKTTTALLIIIALLYAAFLTMDLCLTNGSTSSMLKYCAVLLCLTIAVLSYKNPYSKQDCKALITAMLFTALADYLLLFTSKTTIGVMVFCIAHLAHIARINKSAFKAGVVIYLMAAVLLSALAAIGLTLPYLYIACAIYVALILTATITAFRADMPKRNLILIRTGMVLFVLCDICVALFNVLHAGGMFYEAALLLIWLFYVPSQISLALSARQY